MLAGPTAARALLPIANLLWRQIEAFGRCSFGWETKSKALDTFTDRWLGFIHSYYQTLEELCDLHFAPGEPAVLYNTVAWPAGAGPGGMAGGELAVCPSQLVASYVSSWDLHNTEHGWSPAMVRVLRAALWHWRQSGLQPALRYVLELQRHGYILKQEVAFGSLSWLLAAGMASGGNMEAPLALVEGGRLPDDVRDLAKITLRQPDLDSPLSGERLGSELEAILAAAEEDLERVRQSQSFDEWLLGQSYLSGSMAVVLHVFRKLGGTPLALKARLDQFEEIRADAGALDRLIRSGYAALLVQGFRRYRLLMVSYRQADPGGWRRRLLRERAVFPAAIGDLLLDEKWDALPPAWQRLSPPLAAVLTQALLGHDSAAIAERSQPDGRTDREALEARVDRAFERARSGGPHAAVEWRQLLDDYPWSDFFHLELGIALDLSGEPEASLDHLITAVVVRPREPSRWHSLAVVLRRLGHHDEAMIAFALSETLKADQGGQPSA